MKVTITPLSRIPDPNKHLSYMEMPLTDKNMLRYLTEKFRKCTYLPYEREGSDCKQAFNCPFINECSIMHGHLCTFTDPDDIKTYQIGNFYPNLNILFDFWKLYLAKTPILLQNSL